MDGQQLLACMLALLAYPGLALQWKALGQPINEHAQALTEMTIGQIDDMEGIGAAPEVNTL